MSQKPVRVCTGIRMTGELQGESGPPEQALVLETSQLETVVTGCAHPGVVAMVERAQALTGGKVRAVLGGFHLGGASDTELRGIATRLQELGIRWAGPCHCSSDRARTIFAEIFGEGYLEVHVGSVISRLH